VVRVSVFRVPVEIDWNGPGAPGANVWHCRTDVSSGGLQDEQLQGAVDALHSFYSDLLGIFVDGSVFTLGQVVDMQTDEGHAPDWTTITAGNSAADAPPMLAVCVSWKTTLVARRGSGRTFLGPLASSVVGADGTPDDTVLAGIGTQAQNLINTSRGDNGYAIGIWGLESPYGGVGPAPSDTPRVLRDIIAYRLRDQFAVLRSRRD
jgi:hypothetical protein